MLRAGEKGKPVNTSGEILFSGDPTLDGPVKDPLEMIQKLAASERVKQVFVRHVFRFWMGRNETINDAPILQDAYKAYSDSNGSMKALLISLLTSDAFLYRKVTTRLIGRIRHDALPRHGCAQKRRRRRRLAACL